MGLNLCVMTLDGKYHPKWDDARYSGDRDFFSLVADVPAVTKIDDVDSYWRPTDFAAMRAVKWPDYNTERWAHMADILEAEPEYWVSPNY